MDAEGTFFDVGKENQKFNFIEGSKIFCGSEGKWLEGITRVDWTLDDVAKTLHKTVYLTLLENLTAAS